MPAISPELTRTTTRKCQIPDVVRLRVYSRPVVDVRLSLLVMRLICIWKVLTNTVAGSCHR